MKKIAICIPTYNREKVIEDICLKIINIIDDEIADIFVVDSSSNTATEEKLKKIKKNNFYYYRMNNAIHSSEKVYHIYQNESIQNNYEYLWLLPDYFFVSENVMGNILQKLDEKWDMLMLDFYDPDKRGDKQYFDPQTIFFEYAWSLTQYGIIIINCNTILKAADWTYLEKKYLRDGFSNFSHLAMYFEMMLKIVNLKFYHLSISRTEIYISKYKNENSDYLDNFLDVWGEVWYKSIYALPQYYQNKDIVIKKACIYTNSLGKKNIAKLRLRGILSIKSFQKYKSIWNVVSTVPLINVYAIIFFPKYIVKYIAEYGGIKEGILHKISLIKFKLFYKRNTKLYLYGAGIKAKKTADFMIKNSITFEGFIVTKLENNETYLKDHKVIEISQLLEKEEIGIILALNEKNKKEVIPFLYERGYRNLFKLDIV